MGNMDPPRALDAAALEQILHEHPATQDALLPILHAIQDALGYVPSGAVPEVADRLNLSRAEVHGVLTYYHHFRQHPPGRHVIEVCRAEACQARGADLLAAHAEGAVGCGFHATRLDGAVTLQPVYCLGHCAVGPNIAIDAQPHARMTPARFDALLRTLVEGGAP